MLEIYWVLLVPVFLLSLLSEISPFGDGNPNAGRAFKRLLISVMLLISFDWTINLIASLGDGITDRIDGIKQLWDTLGEIGLKYVDGSDGYWFQVRKTVVYILGLLSYMIAYLGVFTANALVHFVWTILFIASPLMILAYVHEKSAFVTASLYKGLINVILWKIVASVLGVLMLKLITNNQVTEDWASAFSFIAINICVGLSLLFIPKTTSSLIHDGLGTVASGLAMAPAVAALSATKMAVTGGASKLKGAALFGARPVNNYLQRISKPMTDQVEKAKSHWEKIGKQKKYARKSAITAKPSPTYAQKNEKLMGKK